MFRNSFKSGLTNEVHLERGAIHSGVPGTGTAGDPLGVDMMDPEVVSNNGSI